MGSSVSIAQEPAASIEEIARLIEELGRSSGFERRRKIGETVFAGLFGGSRLAWRARGAVRSPSFRELAARLDGRISKSELHRSVKTYLLATDLPFLQSSLHLTVSHADAVDGLGRAEQERLLRLAERELWSVRHLRDERRKFAAARQSSLPKRRGRPKASLPQLAITVARDAERRLKSMRSALERAEGVSPSQRESVMGSVAGIRFECDRIASWLERLPKG